MRISDWGADVCSADLTLAGPAGGAEHLADRALERLLAILAQRRQAEHAERKGCAAAHLAIRNLGEFEATAAKVDRDAVRFGNRRKHAMSGGFGLLLAREQPDVEAGFGCGGDEVGAVRRVDRKGVGSGKSVAVRVGLGGRR